MTNQGLDATRRMFVLGGMAGAALSARAQSYPSRPVRFVIPFAVGGSADVIGRMLAQRLSEDLGQTFVVDNKAGANTIIGADSVAKSGTDGSAVLFTGDQTVAINPFLYANLPYSAERDLIPVTMVAQVKLVLAVSAELPVKSVEELIAYAKAKPGLNYASSGNGSMQHLAMALLAQRTGLTLTHVPYKGGGPATQALLGNEVQLLFGGTSNLIAHANAGRVKLLAVSSATRSAATPQLPTLSEAGVPGYDVITWTGLFVPRGTPDRIIERLHSAVGKAMLLPASVRAAEANGFEVAISESPQDFRKIIERDAAKWSEVIRVAGVKAEI